MWAGRPNGQEEQDDPDPKGHPNEEEARTLRARAALDLCLHFSDRFTALLSLERDALHLLADARKRRLQRAMCKVCQISDTAQQLSDCQNKENRRRIDSPAMTGLQNRFSCDYRLAITCSARCTC